MSPDPYSGSYDIGNPQSLNRYAYVGNHPLSATDRSGLDTGWYGSCHDDYNYCVTVTTTEPWGDEDWTYNGWWGVSNAPPRQGDPGGSSAGSSDPAQPAPQPGPAPNKQNVFKCAANAADKVSVAGGAHKLGVPESGVATFVTDAIGGNTFSALTNVVATFGSRFQNQGGHGAIYNMGQGIVAGPTQGLGPLAGKSIEGTPFATGPVDALLGKVLGDAAPVVGEVKLCYDFLTYVGAAVGCATGHFQGASK